MLTLIDVPLIVTSMATKGVRLGGRGVRHLRRFRFCPSGRGHGRGRDAPGRRFLQTQSNR